jgi:hypothetical protein
LKDLAEERRVVSMNTKQLQVFTWMKVSELLRTTFVVVVFPIALALLTNAQGQETQPPRQSSESRSADIVRYDLEIVNGSIVRVGSTSDKQEATLGNVIDAVRQRYPDANVAMSPGLSRLKISDLKLRTRSIWEDLEAIRVASGGKFDWSGPSSPMFGRPSFPDPARVTEGQVDTSVGLFTLREAVTPERERSVEAFNIGPYLQHEETKEIAGPGQGASGDQPKAIAASREKRLAEVEQIILETIGALHDEEIEKPRFQFHRGANLLIVIGSREAVEVARKIVSALPGQGNMTVAQEMVAPVKAMSPESEVFRRRYGLAPATGLSQTHNVIDPATGVPTGTLKTPPAQGEARDNAAQDAFRKRYGLDRVPLQGQPPQGPPAPGSKPQQ